MFSSPSKVSKLFIKFLKWGKILKARHLIDTYPTYILPWNKAFNEAFINKCMNSCKWIYEYCIINNIHLDIPNLPDIFIYACDTKYWDFVKLIITNEKYQWLDIAKKALNEKKLMEYNFIQLIKLNLL